MGEGQGEEEEGELFEEGNEEVEVRRKGRRLTFWNIAGLRQKDREVWKFLEEGDFISITETWMEEKEIKFMENKLSKKWCWKFFPAVREKRRGRAKGGILIGVKKEWDIEKRRKT